MFAIAQIYHSCSNFDVDAIFDLLRFAEIPVTKHLWKGLSLSIPQVRYHAHPGDIVIQTDPADFSQEELAEIAVSLTAKNKERLTCSTARIDILPFQPDATSEQYETWLTNGIKTQVPVESTLDNPLVSHLCRLIASAVDGFLFDNTENRFVRVPGDC